MRFKLYPRGMNDFGNIELPTTACLISFYSFLFSCFTQIQLETCKTTPIV